VSALPEAVQYAVIVQAVRSARTPERGTMGPHRWHEMTPADFGPEHDFDTEYHGPHWVLDPRSEAALQWCYAHLPQDCPRFGGCAFIIESAYMEPIIVAARRDGLLTRKDYRDRMNNEQILQAQWSQEALEWEVGHE
jgi:hypothetical protein